MSAYGSAGERTHLPAGPGVSTGDKERRKDSLWHEECSPADIQLQRTQWPGPAHHCGGHASCLGDSRFLSRAHLAEGDSKASAKCPSWLLCSAGSSFRSISVLPAFSASYPGFQKAFLPIKSSTITHNYLIWEATSPRIQINTDKKDPLSSVLKDGNQIHRN